MVYLSISEKALSDSQNGALCLSIWGFGWKTTALTGILKAQSRQNLSAPIYGIRIFFSFEILIPLYEPQPLLKANLAL